MKRVLLAIVLALWLVMASAADPRARSPFDYEVLTYIWVIALSTLGALASFIGKVRSGIVRAFNFTELIGECVVAAFVGLLTFWLTEWADMDKLLAAALIGISSHMGSRAIFLLEKSAEAWWMRRFAKGSFDDRRDAV